MKLLRHVQIELLTAHQEKEKDPKLSPKDHYK